MKIKHLHGWDVSSQEAIRIQKKLRSRLELGKSPGPIERVAGTDVSFSRKSGRIWAGVVVFSYPELCRIEEQWIRDRVSFPYIPGLLSFRELPVLLKALERVKTDPQLFFATVKALHIQGDWDSPPIWVSSLTDQPSVVQKVAW